MLPNWNDLQGAEEHRRELLAMAAHARLAAEAGAPEPPRARRTRYARALARLGRLMMDWGARLQQFDPAP